MTPRDFAKVGDVLPALLRQLGLDKRFREQRLLGLWSEVVGDEIAERTRATRVDRGVLFVHVDHGAWMQELHFIEKELIEKLRASAPGVELNRIRFTTRDH